MKISYKFLDPQLSGKIIHFIEREVETIGSDESSSIHMNGLSILKKHATLKRTESGLTIEAKGDVQKNGVKVTNDLLTDGDIIVFGVTQTHIYALIDKTKKPTDKIDIPNFDDIQDKLDFKLELTPNDSELQENLRNLTRKGMEQKNNDSSIVDKSTKWLINFMKKLVRSKNSQIF